MDIRSVVRTLLGLKTAREEAIDEELEKTRQQHRTAGAALDEAKRKMEAAQANIHARADAFQDQTGGFGERQQGPGQAQAG